MARMYTILGCTPCNTILGCTPFGRLQASPDTPLRAGLGQDKGRPRELDVRWKSGIAPSSSGSTFACFGVFWRNNSGTSGVAHATPTEASLLAPPLTDTPNVYTKWIQPRNVSKVHTHARRLKIHEKPIISPPPLPLRSTVRALLLLDDDLNFDERVKRHGRDHSAASAFGHPWPECAEKPGLRAFERGDVAVCLRSDERRQPRRRTHSATGTDDNRSPFKLAVASKLVAQQVCGGAHARAIPQHNEVLICGQRTQGGTAARQEGCNSRTWIEAHTRQFDISVHKHSEVITEELPDPFHAPNVPEIPSPTPKASNKQFLRQYYRQEEGNVEGYLCEHQSDAAL
eukprot:scaffold39524_cov78-Phaeocystis_antarctica.AAC.1